MKPLTVRQLARLSGVSVRTLHYYDERGLLRPARIGANGYRWYGEAEVLRLQQILLHRELGVPLQEIAEVLDATDAARLELLERQRARLTQGLDKHRRMLATVDRTIAWLRGSADMKTGEFFEGLEPRKQPEYEEWLVKRHGPEMRERIAAGRAWLAGQGEDQLRSRMAELEAVEAALAACCAAGVDAASADLDPLLERHRRWVEAMWGRPCAPAAYQGLADTYLAHPDFVARYETRLTGFSGFLAAAMKSFAGRMVGGSVTG
jgi:DNA-binding transcriptional MerR regulator